MGDRRSVHVKIDEDVWEDFKKFVVETHGQKYGNLGREAENALKEYVDRDRLTRVEENTVELLALVRELDATRTHKASETLAKTERIADRLHRLDRTVIPDDEVVRAIEQGPGGDDRTVEKYQNQLKRQGLAYEHPTDAVWFVDREAWVKAVEGYLDNNPTADLHEVLEPYPFGLDEYDRVAEREVLA